MDSPFAFRKTNRRAFYPVPGAKSSLVGVFTPCQFSTLPIQENRKKATIEGKFRTVFRNASRRKRSGHGITKIARRKPACAQNAVILLRSKISRHRTETVSCHQRQQLQRRAARPLLATLPLAHQTRRHIEVACEHRLARILAQPKRVDVLRRHLLDGRETHFIERTHRAFRHDACLCQTEHGLVHRRHRRPDRQLCPRHHADRRLPARSPARSDRNSATLKRWPPDTRNHQRIGHLRCRVSTLKGWRRHGSPNQGLRRRILQSPVVGDLRSPRHENERRPETVRLNRETGFRKDRTGFTCDRIHFHMSPDSVSNQPDSAFRAGRLLDALLFGLSVRDSSPVKWDRMSSRRALSRQPRKLLRKPAMTGLRPSSCRCGTGNREKALRCRRDS